MASCGRYGRKIARNCLLDGEKESERERERKKKVETESERERKRNGKKARKNEMEKTKVPIGLRGADESLDAHHLRVDVAHHPVRRVRCHSIVISALSVGPR